MRARASLALLGAALACAGGADGPAGGAITDDAGRTVVIAAPPGRIVSLSPATTELLFALGAGDRVVGRTRWCEDPAAARAVTSVGDGLSPNVELILARRPDLVVFYHSPLNARAIERLHQLGVASASFRLDGLDDLRRTARLLGRIVSDSARADSLVRRFDQALATAAAEGSSSVPRVLLLAWADPPIVLGARSFLSEVVSLAGGVNVFGDLDRPSASVSLEAIAARDPDLILVTTQGEEAAFMRRPEWQAIEAVRERRLAQVVGSEFSRPSFRVVDAVRKLRGAFERWSP